MKITESCSVCGKPLVMLSSEVMTHGSIVKYRCGHAFFVDEVKDLSETDGELSDAELRKPHVLENPPEGQEAPATVAKYASVKGAFTAYEYQKNGLDFAKKTGFKCLIADAMGLGKTIQALLAIREADEYPVVCVVKSATIFQWQREAIRWGIADAEETVLPIVKNTGFIPSGFKIYLVSMDMLARKPKASKLAVWEKLAALGPKMIILDECQLFKDESSKRTIAMIKLIQTANIQKRILLSGTPIKNRADEYFVALNLIAPHYFTSKAKFCQNWLVANEKGAYTRIAPWQLPQFKAMTANFILRREKSEVLLDLPSLSRHTTALAVDDEDVKDSYNKELDLFANAMNSGAMSSMDILGWLTKMRHLTAQAKLPAAIDVIKEFLENTDECEKITIGIHHKDIRDTLMIALADYNPLKLSGEDSATQKDNIVEEFKKPHRRVLICNILAGGVGLNIQHCANAAILERQWNSADEEQFESRFHRNGQTRGVVIDYLIAHGTIDQFFSEMVDAKRRMFGETMTYNLAADSDTMRDLAEQVIANRL
jgi:SNF2 family DNA or RNA helicase